MPTARKHPAGPTLPDNKFRAPPNGLRPGRRPSGVRSPETQDLWFGFLPQATQGLETAKPADLDVIEISPSGLGLHFPKLDADLYVPALLEGVLGSRHWTAAQLGKKGGSVRSAAKAETARANGRRGGRPRAAST